MGAAYLPTPFFQTGIELTAPNPEVCRSSVASQDSSSNTIAVWQPKEHDGHWDLLPEFEEARCYFLSGHAELLMPGVTLHCRCSKALFLPFWKYVLFEPTIQMFWPRTG